MMVEWQKYIWFLTCAYLFLLYPSFSFQKTILTAAHCVALKDSTRPMQPAQLLIYLGKYSLLQWHGPEQDVKVSEIIIHPNYDNEKFFSDLAIVKLKTEARFSEYVRPVCLWGFNKELRGIVNKIGRVPGFGYNEYGIVDDKLSYVNMPVVTHETCIWSNRDFFSRITSNVTYCAGFKNGSERFLANFRMKNHCSFDLIFFRFFRLQW